MSNDPYGFPDQASATAKASSALWAGVGSSICAATGMCACYVPFFIGAPLGLWAAYTAMQAMDHLTDERDRTLANAGMMAGLAGGLVSTGFALIIVLYVAFLFVYFAAVFLFVGAAALSGQ